MNATPENDGGDDIRIETLASTHFDDIGRAYAGIARTAAAALGVDRVSIWLFSADFQRLHRVHDHRETGRNDFGLSLDLSQRPDYVETLAAGALFSVEQADEAPHAGDTLTDYMVANGIRSMLDAPIRVGDELTGVVCHEQAERRAWNGVERDRALRIGAIAARIIAADRRHRSAALSRQARLLVEDSADAMAIASPRGALEYLNPRARTLLGLAPDEPLFGLRLVDFLQPASRTQGTQRIYPAARENGSWTGRVHLRTRQDSAVEATATLNVYRGSGGHIEHLFCVLRDIAAGRHLDARIEEMRHRHAQVLSQAGECLIVIDPVTLALRNASSGLERVLGYDDQQTRALSLYDICAEPAATLETFVRRVKRDEHLLCGETRVRHAQGHWVDVEMSMVWRAAGGRRRASISVQLHDITERIQRRRDIERLAYYDPLTGLANANLLRERAEGMLADCVQHGRSVGFLLLQLDRWQRILDIQGYQIAESLIRQVGRRLKRAFRQREVLLARVLGGVEFGVLYDASVDDAQNLARIAHEAFREPFRADRAHLHLSIRTANARAPLHAVNFKDLTKRAGIALRNAYLRNLAHCEYDPTQSSRLHDERLIEEDLRTAITTGDLPLRFQPIRSVAPGRTSIGAEALIRWRHPQLGLLAPQDFVPVAEENQLIMALDRYVLRSAAASAARWYGDFGTLSVAVNVSVVTLLNGDLPSLIAEVLDSSGLVPARLCLEITETAVMHDHRTATRILTAIKQQGVHVALDDFGTGYSSLAYLKDLPIDTLKIDRDFVRGIGADSRDEHTIETIIRLGHDLGIEVLAEGVETRFQLEWLTARDIDYAQGFYISMPLTERSLLTGRFKTRHTRH